MTDLADSYVGTFTALLPTGPMPVLEQPAVEARSKAREPRTRFSCLLPVAPEGSPTPVYVKDRGCREKVVEAPALTASLVLKPKPDRCGAVMLDVAAHDL